MENTPEPVITSINHCILDVISINHVECSLNGKESPWAVVAMAVDVESDRDLGAGPVAGAEVIRLLHDPSVLERLTDAVLA
jgi:hypothetical protein